MLNFLIIEASETNKSRKNSAINYSAESVDSYENAGTLELMDYEEVQTTTLPNYVKDKMTESELLESSRDLIKRHFNLIEISFYLRSLQKTDFMNFVVIVSGMIKSENYKLIEDLIGIWGYYLTLQDDPNREVLRNLMEIIESQKFESDLSKFLTMSTEDY